ncbi:MAG: hypothetical protein R2911_36085 [Caldilineaceae bacterium]
MTIDRMAWAMVGIIQIFALVILGIALAGVHITWWGILGGALVAVAMIIGIVLLSRRHNAEHNNTQPNIKAKVHSPRGSTAFRTKKTK